jgi:hypothetical protein
MVSTDVDHCIEAFSLRTESDPAPQSWALLGDPEEVREQAIQMTAWIYGPDPDGNKFPSLYTVAKRIRKVREDLLKKWRSAHPLKKSLDDVISHWKELRAGLRLYAPRSLPDDEKDPSSNHRYNEYLLFAPDSSFSKTVRRFASAAVSDDGLLPDFCPPTTFVPFPCG